MEVVEALREAGAEVLGIVSIFTYDLDKGKKRLAEAGVDNHSLTDIHTLLDTAVEEKYITVAQKEEVKAFFETLNK